VATISLQAPASAASGSTISVSTSLRALADGSRIITRPATSDLLIVSGALVVGRAGGLRSDLAVPLLLRRQGVRPAQVVPSSLRLVSCPRSAGASATGAPSTPLPPGEYALVAVLGYTMDSLYSGADGGIPTPGAATGFVLVSRPVPVRVTAGGA
jgi:hypothetical protein